jgi:hypothetical protein
VLLDEVAEHALFVCVYSAVVCNIKDAH